jgi:hypothetical protein
MRWYPLAIRSGYEQANEGAGAFIERVGRRKLILPIYAELVKTPKAWPGQAGLRKGQAGLPPDHHRIGGDMLARAEASAAK